MTTIELQGKHGNGLVSQVDDDDADLLKQYKWSVKVISTSDGTEHPKEVYTSYVEIETGKRIKISMQRMILDLNTGDKTKVKHANGDVFDNRKSNFIITKPKKKKRKLRELKIAPSHSYRGDVKVGDLKDLDLEIKEDIDLKPKTIWDTDKALKIGKSTDDLFGDLFHDPPIVPLAPATEVKQVDVDMTQSEEIKKEKEEKKKKVDEKDKLISKVVEAFMSNDGMFSSVDISNHIKKELKTWIKNTEVSTYLRKYSIEVHKLDKTITIMDSIKNISGKLYYIDGADPKDYTGADQKAMTPAEFDLIVNGG